VFGKNPNSGLSSFLHLSFCLKRDELEKKERIHNREKARVRRLNAKSSKKITEYYKKKSANNAARKIFKCFIHLCFFHFSQSGWRRVQINGLVKAWYEDDFRLSFKKIQALAFLPVHDVIEGFEIISRGK
jgi:hypothetical protein